MRKSNDNQRGVLGEMIRRIGCFKKMGNDFIGEIATVDFKTSARIAPVVDKSNNPLCPDFLILHSETSLFSPELGVGWQRQTSDGTAYIEVTLDDPGYARPVNGVLYKGNYEGPYELWNLFWSRTSSGSDLAEKVSMHEELIPYIGVVRPIQKVTDYLLSIYPSLEDESGVELGYEP